MCEHATPEYSNLMSGTINFGGLEFVDDPFLALGHCNARIACAYSDYALKQVAIKCIPKDHGQEIEAQIIALRREIVVWYSLVHENIVSLLGTTVMGPAYHVFLSPSCVADYFDHGDLMMYIRSKYTMDDLTRVELLRGVAAGLQYLHGQGIIHGDIKPTNTVVDSNLQAKICDFGSAHIPDCPTESCIAGSASNFRMLATEVYLSPEIAISHRDPPTTRQSDIWAFGCVLLEAIVEVPPYNVEFIEDDEEDWIMKRFRGEPPAGPEPFSLNQITEAVGLLASKCWNPVAERRPSAQVLVNELGIIIMRFEDSFSCVIE